MFSDSLSLLPLYVALASQRGAILLPSSHWRKREEREKFVLCLSIFSKGTKGTKGCVEDLPEISRATNVRRRRGTCRIESSIRLHFLEQGRERVFFFWNALRLFYLVRFGEYLEVQEMQGES